MATQVYRAIGAQRVEQRTVHTSLSSTSVEGKDERNGMTNSDHLKSASQV